MMLFRPREIVVRLIGGLGNQLFQYALGRQISLLKQVPLKLDLSAFQNDPDRSFALHRYNIAATIASDKEVARYTAFYDHNTLFARLYRKAESKILPRFKRRYFKEIDYYVYDDEVMQVAPKVLIEGFWQHCRYFENLDPRVLKELTLKEKFLNAIPAVISEIKQNDTAVALHVRRGDYVANPDNLNWFGVMPVSYYQQAIDYIRNQIVKPVFYIFSDDLEWAKQNIVTDASVVYVDIDGGTKDYLELYAMSTCRHNIIANSSFSWWGAFLNTNPNKIVIAPEQWIAAPEVNEHVAIQMPDWIKV